MPPQLAIRDSESGDVSVGVLQPAVGHSSRDASTAADRVLVEKEAPALLPAAVRVEEALLPALGVHGGAVAGQAERGDAGASSIRCRGGGCAATLRRGARVKWVLR